MQAKEVIFCSDDVKGCDLCKKRISRRPGSVFVDGRTRLISLGSTWAMMCQECFDRWGVGLGVGKGQMFSFRNKQWRKVAG